MESTTSYLKRKSEEIRFLAGFANEGSEAPDVGTVADVIHSKARLRKQLLAANVDAVGEATETNISGRPMFPTNGIELRYGYQRFDLEVTCPPLYTPVESGSALQSLSFSHSGMSGITAVLLSLNNVSRAGREVFALEDCYFETAHLLRTYTPRLRIHTFPSTEDLRAALRSRPTTHGKDPPVVLVDSICSEDSIAHGILKDIEPRGIVVLDSTCYEMGHPTLRDAVDGTLDRRVPMVLVRSHTKLDGLGIEFGRLGSVAFLVPTRAPREVLAAVTDWLRAFSDAMSRLGLRGSPLFIPPFLFHPSFDQLNRRRLERIRENARFVHRALQRRPGGASQRVRSYHHGLFVTVPWRGDTRAQMRQRAAALADSLLASGIPAIQAESFGFDFVATSAYHDALADEDTLRVCIPDYPEEAMITVIDALDEHLSG